MKLYLSRRFNGLYQLTRLKPTITEIMGTNNTDAYPQPGDPIVFGSICPIMAKLLFKSELEPCDVVCVDLVCNKRGAERVDDKREELGNDTVHIQE